MQLHNEEYKGKTDKVAIELPEHKTCAECGEDLIVQQWGSQSYDWSKKLGRYIPMFEMNYAYSCPTCNILKEELEAQRDELVDGLMSI